MTTNRQAIHEPKYRASGVFLLDENSLLDLDKIIENSKKKLEQYLDVVKKDGIAKLIQQAKDETEAAKIKDNYHQKTPEQQKYLDSEYALREKNHSYYSREKLISRAVSVRLKLKSGQKYYPNFQSLAEANKSLELDKCPESFEYEIKSGDFSDPSISVKYSTSIHYSLEIEGKPDDNVIIEEIFSELNDWSRRRAPSIPFRIWTEGGGFLSWVAIILFLGMLSLSGKATNIPSPLANEITESLKNGITQANSPKALELLLRISSGEAMQVPGPSSEKYSMIALIIGIIVAIFLFVRPKQGIIGLKNGANKIKFWRLWIKFVTFSVPAFIAIYIVTKILDKLA